MTTLADLGSFLGGLFPRRESLNSLGSFRDIFLEEVLPLEGEFELVWLI